MKQTDRIYNKNLIPLAKELRNNMTKEERHLWYDFLKTYPVKFTRQKVYGSYILDFYSSSAKLVIELDGSQHFEDKDRLYDTGRDEYLKEHGLTVLRIPNNEINEKFEEVCEYIDNTVKQSPQSAALTAPLRHKGSLK